MQRSVIDDFENNVKQLISEAAAYVAAGQQDVATEANIRKLRLLSAGLNAALQSVQFMPPMFSPPTVAPPEVEPAAAAPARAR